MESPVGFSRISKRDGLVALTKRDDCYGTEHNDYEGGWYKFDGIGAFGTEVYGAD